MKKSTVSLRCEELDDTHLVEHCERARGLLGAGKVAMVWCTRKRVRRATMAAWSARPGHITVAHAGNNQETVARAGRGAGGERGSGERCPAGGAGDTGRDVGSKQALKGTSSLVILVLSNLYIAFQNTVTILLPE